MVNRVNGNWCALTDINDIEREREHLPNERDDNKITQTHRYTGKNTETEKK